MRQVMVRYKVKPNQATKNEALVKQVFEELHQTAPSGLRYTTFIQDDGVSFVHVFSAADDAQSSLTDFAAFRAFQENIADRCDEPPAVVDVREVGSYGFGGD